jgi:hypothetical protein
MRFNSGLIYFAKDANIQALDEQREHTISTLGMKVQVQAADRKSF